MPINVTILLAYDANLAVSLVVKLLLGMPSDFLSMSMPTIDVNC